MRPAAWLSLCALTLLPLSVAPADAGGLRHGADQTASFRRFLQQYLAARSDDADELKGTRYAVAFADLNGDGAMEAIAYVSGDFWCGSGGCHAYIFTPNHGGYRKVMSTTITKLPIRLLMTTHHGWRDIGVFVQGGGIDRGYEAVLAFDGRRYPSNPSMPPARHPRRAGQGKTLIAVRDYGRWALYPSR